MRVWTSYVCIYINPSVYACDAHLESIVIGLWSVNIETWAYLGGGYWFKPPNETCRKIRPNSRQSHPPPPNLSPQCFVLAKWFVLIETPFRRLPSFLCPLLTLNPLPINLFLRLFKSATAPRLSTLWSGLIPPINLPFVRTERKWVGWVSGGGDCYGSNEPWNCNDLSVCSNDFPDEADRSNGRRLVPSSFVIPCLVSIELIS